MVFVVKGDWKNDFLPVGAVATGALCEFLTLNAKKKGCISSIMHIELTKHRVMAE